MIGILKSTIKNIDNDVMCIANINQLAQHNINHCLFCDSIADNFILPVNTNILQRVHIFNFSDIVITDDLMRAQDLINVTYPKKRFLYLYHLDWPYIQNLKFKQNRS